MNPGPYKIQITNPCAEDWNAMKPDDKGRFCDACSKSVIDFSGKSDAEIKAYVLERKGENICGRFQKQQVDRIRIEVDQNILHTSIPFWQKFLVIFLVCFGADFMGVDFCFAQVDTTGVPVIQTENTLVDNVTDTLKTDSAVVGTALADSVFLQTPFIFNPLIGPDYLSGPISIHQVILPVDMPIYSMISGMCVIVDEKSELDEDISLIDTLQADTTTTTATLPLLPGFRKNGNKNRSPKNTTPERPQNYIIADEKKRRRRKKKADGDV